MRILTIGHGDLPIEAFRRLLEQHGISMLVDVRSAPFSSRNPQYSKRALDALMVIAGIRYVYLGDKLGGRPEDRSLCDHEGKPDYQKIARSAGYRQGIEELIGLTRDEDAAAIMCSESDYHECHRYKLVARTLALSGVDVKHIMKDGCLDDNPAAQLALPGGA